MEDNCTTQPTSHSPTPDYTESTDSTIDSPSPDLDSFTDSSVGSQDSIFESTFESMDHLVLAELLEPPHHFTADGTEDFPLPEVGHHWKDLNDYDANAEIHEEETNGEERGHDEDENIGGDEEESGESATDAEITEFIVQQYKKTGKQFHPRGHLLWKKFGRRGNKSTGAMIHLFITRISPRLIELTLPKELHLGLLKQARTTIECEEKEALEKKHCVKIILSPHLQINSWEDDVSKRLVPYSDSSDDDLN